MVDMSVLDGPLVFVDIETNGLDHVRGRVIEVAAIRVEGGKAVKSFNSLVDPETELPYFITNLTGITASDLKGAPTFAQVADELNDIINGAVFVAHNVRFDYSFLKQEFKRLNQPFLPKQLCTVKLSRALYPHEKSHKLQSLIDRHGFTYESRHRAYDDAAILWQFLQYVQKHFPPEQVMAAINRQVKSPAIPRDLQPELVRDLPETPGVYIFEDASGRPLYVGKSINIKKRVMSHFGRDHAESREFKIAQSIKHIRTQQTSGELAALLLESRLVKELQPVYNRQLRRINKMLLAKQALSAEGYITVVLEEASQIDPLTASSILAVYPRRGRAKDAMNELVRTFDLCPKLMGLEKANGACFMRQLHKCRGACVGQEPADIYNQRLQTAFENQRIQAWPFKGPIMLEESWQGDSTHAIIVDNWCVMGELTQEPYCEPVVSWAEQAFDLDTYKILHSQLTRKIKQLTIRPLDKQALMQLGS
jgi:DNA polymerase-3 subunit epsilon